MMETNAERDDVTESDDEISLLEIWSILVRRRRLVLGLPLIAMALSAAVLWYLPDTYTGVAQILPPPQSTSAATALLGQLGGGLGGAAAGLAGLKNPADLYVGMLKSRTVADKLVERFKLQQVYEQHYVSETRKKLEKRSTISAGKDGIIVIAVDDHDPQRAADLANAYVEELRQLTSHLAITEASRRRLFFEQQFAATKDNLIKAEVAARQGLDSGGLVKVDEQGRALVEMSGRLRAQISGKEVQLNAMRNFAAEGNPQLQALEQELRALRAELAKVEGSTPAADAQHDASGLKGVRNIGLLRELKYQEALYEIMAKQYEAARIDEARDSAIIQVLDAAVPPDRNSGPRRMLITALIGVAAFVGSASVIIIGRQTPRYAQMPSCTTL